VPFFASTSQTPGVAAWFSASHDRHAAASASTSSASSSGTGRVSHARGPLAVVAATVVTQLRAPSIYSARISAAGAAPAPPHDADAGPPELHAPGDLLPETMG
jgi:hypothetical protein